MVLVGSRKDSQTYVRSKKKACAEVGIKSFDADLPEDVSEDELLKVQSSLSGERPFFADLCVLVTDLHAFLREDKVRR